MMGKPRKCLLGTLVYIFALLLLLFMVVFVIIPIVFKYSIEIQRSIIFPTWATDGDTDFSDTKSFGLKGVRNFYVTVDHKDNVTLGAWQILPNTVLSNAVDDQYYNYEEILANKNYNIIIYLHGNGGLRSSSLELYTVLRQYFQIIAIDYRGYGDSTNKEITEANIVRDIVNFYKWIQAKTKARIFVWGHSLGTGVSTHTISNLKAENVIPSGLVLETPFSTITDVMERHFFVKLISWLPWYRTTMLNPIIYNDFGFESTKYILDVDCPIMILHAKDDEIVPYDLATKLYNTAIKNRNFTTQGNITYHLFEAKGLGHMLIYLEPTLPKVIRRFVEVCIDFENKTHNTTAA
ncbi:lysophosphatidylserine lipase ABHD12-like [Zophobas morio]|uniref:lysophosphatidylserine lipase ABHD12-like n=1 Tax=Zophobas morio TaxID=2755281 RepID=UPI003082AD26